MLLSLNHRRAFTLIEMLVVVTIIVLLMAFATPALTRTLQASRLASAGDSLMGAIAEAQQIAFASNAPVDLRFFKYKDGIDQVEAFRSYQLFKITQLREGNGGSATTKENIEPAAGLILLPEGVLVVTDDNLSKSLSGEGFADEKEDSSVGYSGVAEAKYNAIRFMPDGSCRKVGMTETVGSLSFATLTFQTLTESFFTITFDVGKEITIENLPKNFYTIQIDPYTGKARNYKPGF